MSTTPVRTNRRPVPWVVWARCRTLAPKLLRLAAYFAVVGLVSGAFVVRSVWGSITERSLAVGRQMQPFADLIEGAHVVHLNGESVHFSSHVSQQSVGEILDRFEAHCMSHSGGFEKSYAELPPEVLTRLKASPFWQHRYGIAREQTDHDGAVTCVAQAGDGGFLAAVARLKSFLATGDVSQFGELRSVYVSKTKEGASHVLVSWTEGSFNVYRMFGRDGAEQDLPGNDPVGAPRPPNSRRLFTAQVDQAPLSVATYTTDAAERDVLTTYAQQLAGAGWKQQFGTEAVPGTIFERQGVTLVVAVSRDEYRKKTIVSTAQAFAVGARP